MMHLSWISISLREILLFALNINKCSTCRMLISCFCECGEMRTDTVGGMIYRRIAKAQRVVAHSDSRRQVVAVLCRRLKVTCLVFMCWIWAWRIRGQEFMWHLGVTSRVIIPTSVQGMKCAILLRRSVGAAQVVFLFDFWP